MAGGARKPDSNEVQERLDALVRRLAETEALLQQRSSELAMYKGAATFRLATGIGRACDRALPIGSRRRVAAARAARRLLGMARAESVRAPVVAAVHSRSALAPASVPQASDPDVSIVIPVHGEWALTAHCLASLAGTFSLVGYEVVVVDDASPDATRRQLAEVRGVRVVPLDENVGYLRACNAGIAAARAQHVLLLNNDVELQQGALDAMYEALQSAPNVGVVGAKLVYPDGRLQEAGGIVFSDGTAANYGRGDAPDDPRYQHRRDVDYVSGAALLARRELLERSGGYDERYVPAYYEDTDLCFAARALGMRVLYEPRAVVVHAEGGSHGTDPESGLKAYQQRNRAVFAERWSEALREQPDAGTAAEVARVHGAPRRLLVVDLALPMPDKDSGGRRMHELLRLLTGEGWAVTLVPDNGAALEPYAGNLRKLGVEVLPGGRGKALDKLGAGFSAAILSRMDVAERWLPLVQKRLHIPVVFDSVDLHFLREQRQAATGAGGGAAASTKRREVELVRRASATLVVSPVEQEVLRAEVPGARVAVVSNVELPGPVGGGLAARTGLVFVGSWLHPPNLDGLRWFVADVLPLIVAARPDVVLRVVGSGPADDVRRLADEHVDVLGWVPDLGPVYAGTRVSIAPLRYGAGVKGKVGDALRHGLPVVATSVAAEGMHLQPEVHLLVGDDAPSFATAVLRLLEDDPLWQQLAVSGRDRIIEVFSAERAAAVLTGVLDSLA